MMSYAWILILAIQIHLCAIVQTQISYNITGTFRGSTLRIKWNSGKRLIFNLTKIDDESENQSILIKIENYAFQDQLRVKIYVHPKQPGHIDYTLHALQNHYQFNKDYVITMSFVGREVHIKFGNTTKKMKLKYDFPSHDSTKNYPKFIGYGISEIQYKDNINDPNWKTLEPESSTLDISEDELRKLNMDLINKTEQNKILISKSIRDKKIINQNKIQFNKEKKECVDQLNNKTEQIKILMNKSNADNEVFNQNKIQCDKEKENIKQLKNKTKELEMILNGIKSLSTQASKYSLVLITSIIINIILLVLICVGIFLVYFRGSPKNEE